MCERGERCVFEGRGNCDCGIGACVCEEMYVSVWGCDVLVCVKG